MSTASEISDIVTRCRWEAKDVMDVVGGVDRGVVDRGCGGRC